MSQRLCQYCKNPVFVSKENHRTQDVQKNGVWVQLIWHTKCDPFTVKTVVTKR